ncbi:MAG: hypothetical protein H7256_03835 [Bdellovibrio sp.]|nr:hypothetical protein [Bdellovibrio sp.]
MFFALTASWPADAIYSLSPFYANVQSLIFSFIGAVDAKLTGYNSNKMFASSSAAGQFSGVTQIAVDTTNDLMYVAANGNNRIQKLRLSTGLFLGQIGSSSIAAGTCILGSQIGWCDSSGVFVSGTADGAFYSPSSLAIDIAGNALYVSDMGNNRLQKFNLTTGAFIGAIGYGSSASGTCASGKQTAWCTGGTFSLSFSDGGFFYPLGLVIDTVHNTMYVSEVFNNRVQKFTLSTGAYVGAIGKGSAASGTCVSGKQAGWCTGGVFTSGTTDGGFGTGGALAVDTTNSFLYVTDGSYRIQKFTLAGAFVGSIGKSTAAGTCVAGKQNSWCTGGTFSTGTTDGQFAGGSSLLADPTNNLLYVTDSGNSRVQKFTLSTGAYIGSIGRSNVTAGTCVTGIQSAWCTGGTFEIGLEDGAFNGPYAIAVDNTNSRLYIGDNSVRIQRLNLSTLAPLGSIGKVVVPTANWNQTPSDFASNPATFDGAFYNPAGIAMDISNDLFYVSDASINKIIKLKISTGQVIGTIGNSVAKGTCVAGKQNGWCLGGIFSAGGSDGQLSTPYSIAIDTVNDLLYVGDSVRVQKFVLSTGAFVGAIGNSTASGTCIAGKQTAWCTGGTFSAASGDGTFNSVVNLGVDVANNRMYVMDGFGYRVQKFNLSTGAFLGSIGKSTAAGTCIAGAQTTWCTGGTFSAGGALDGGMNMNGAMSLDTANDRLYVTDRDNGRLQKFILSTGAFVGTIGNSTAATGTCIVGKQNGWCTGGTYSAVAGDGKFLGPKAVLVDSGRDLLFVIDQLASNIQKFTLSTGAYIGTIGSSTVKAGTCLAGGQKSWCVGGTYKSGTGSAEFSQPAVGAIDPTNKRMYILDQARVIKIRNY